MWYLYYDISGQYSMLWVDNDLLAVALLGMWVLLNDKLYGAARAIRIPQYGTNIDSSKCDPICISPFPGLS